MTCPPSLNSHLAATCRKISTGTHNLEILEKSLYYLYSRSRSGWISNAEEILAARPRPRLFEIRKLSSKTRFPKKSSVATDSRSRFTLSICRFVVSLTALTVHLLSEGGRGGGGGQREGRGATVHNRGRKFRHDYLYLQSINSIKHQ